MKSSLLLTNWAIRGAGLLAWVLPSAVCGEEPARHELAPAMVLEMLQSGTNGSTRSRIDWALADPAIPSSPLAWCQALAGRSEGQIHTAALCLARDGFWFENPATDSVAFFPLLSNTLRRHLEKAGVTLVTVSGDLHTSDAREIFTAWTRSATANNFSGDLPTSTRSQVIFASLVDFRLPWQSPFDPALTQVDRFHFLYDGRHNSLQWVDLMALEGVFPYYQDDLVEVVVLPTGGGCDFLLLCPLHLDGLPQVEAALEAGRLPAWQAALQPASLLVQLPRMAPTRDMVESRIVERAGLDEGDAGFAATSTVANLRWEAQSHQLQFGWDESGFRSTHCACAVLAGEAKPPPGWLNGGCVFTDGGTVGLDIPREYPAMRPVVANHPFAFALAERSSGNLILRGSVTYPSPSAHPAIASLAGFVPDSVRVGTDLRHGPTLGWTFDRWFPWIWQEDLGWLWLTAPSGGLTPVDRFLAYSPQWGWLQVGVSWRRLPANLIVSGGSIGGNLMPVTPATSSPAPRALWCYAFDLGGWIYLDQESGVPAPAWLLREGVWTRL